MALCIVFLCGCQPESRNGRVAVAPEPEAPAPQAPSPTSPPPVAPAVTTSEATPEAKPQPEPQLQDSERSRLAAQMWGTTLGRMYSHYLFGNDNREKLPDQAREIVDRILSSNDDAAKRVAAMHIMNEDLRVNEQADTDIVAKIALLEDEMVKSRHSTKSNAITVILAQIPFVFLASLPMGSPLIRMEYRKQYKTGIKRIVAKIRSKEVPPREKIPWKRIMSTESLEDYEVGKALSTFSKTFAPVSMVEWLWVQQTEDKAGAEALREELELVKDL